MCKSKRWLIVIVAASLLVLLGWAPQQPTENTLVGSWQAYTVVDSVDHLMQWAFTDTTFTWTMYEQVAGERVASAEGTWEIEEMILKTRYTDNGVVEMFQMAYSDGGSVVVLEYSSAVRCVLYKTP